MRFKDGTKFGIWELLYSRYCSVRTVERTHSLITNSAWTAAFQFLIGCPVLYSERFCFSTVFGRANDQDFTCYLSAPLSVSCAWDGSYKRDFERTQRTRPGRARLRTSSSAGDEGCHSDPRTTPDRRPLSRDIPVRRKRVRVQPYEKVKVTLILGTQTVVYHSHLSPPSGDIRDRPLQRQ